MDRHVWVGAAICLTALCGCDFVDGTGEFGSPPPEVKAPPGNGDATYLKDMVRGNDETPGPSAVDSAMVWARKYTEATEKILQLEKANRALEKDKDALRGRIEVLERELETARGEIADANAMVRAVREENRKWKQNVLGFRSEFMESQQAMLDYQIRIIKLLGGEPQAGSQPTTRPSEPLARKGVPGP
ncbi:MAG: hypothetical protein KGY99_05010 [Phycisphaerae bacterium]|nr:hypothetical protein [Phycisphaerae bacterium]